MTTKSFELTRAMKVVLLDLRRQETDHEKRHGYKLPGSTTQSTVDELVACGLIRERTNVATVLTAATVVTLTVGTMAWIVFSKRIRAFAGVGVPTLVGAGLPYAARHMQRPTFYAELTARGREVAASISLEA